METEVVAISNAVAAETTFLLEEDDDDDENVRTSQFTRFFRRRRRPSPSPFISHLRTTSSSSSSSRRRRSPKKAPNDVLCRRLFDCDETGRNDRDDDDDVEQEVDDDDDGVDALIVTFYVFYLSIKFDENTTGVKKSTAFFLLFCNFCDSISCEKASRGADEYFSKEPLKNSIVRIQTQNTNHTLKVVV